MNNADLPDSLKSLMEGAHPPEDYAGNGCTCSPDFISGTDIRPACHWHDYAYSLGGTEERREKVDRIFKRNLLRCGAGRLWSGVYYRRVAMWGVWHFLYDPDISIPRKLAISVRCFFKRVIWF